MTWLLTHLLEGTEMWVVAEVTYNERVSRVENQIIASLRDRLGIAKNANEMFRVFSKFNALFVRPKVKLVPGNHEMLYLLVMAEITKTGSLFVDPWCYPRVSDAIDR